MLKKFMAICMALVVIGVYSDAQAQRRNPVGKWTKLSGKNIDLRKGRSVLRVSASRPPMRAIRFRALRRSLRLTSVTVYFAGGRRQRIRGMNLRANRFSRTYRITARGQRITSIVVAYRRVNSSRRWIGLQVYGLAAAPAGNVVIGKNDPKKIDRFGKGRLSKEKNLRKKYPGFIAGRGNKIRKPDGTFRTVTKRLERRKPVLAERFTKNKPRLSSRKSERFDLTPPKPRKTERRVARRPVTRRQVTAPVTRAPVFKSTRSGARVRNRTPGGQSGQSGQSGQDGVVTRGGLAKSRSAQNGINSPAQSRTRGVTRSLRAPPAAPPTAAPPVIVNGAPPVAGLESFDGEGRDSDEVAAAAKERTVDAINDETQNDAAKSKDYDIMPVYYGTDRMNEPSAKRPEYNTKRAEKLQLGRALVSVPKTHKMPNVERPWAINIPFWGRVQLQSEDPKKHFTMKELKELKEEDFLRFVKQRLAQSKTYKDQALVFIHGFNNTFDGAIYRTAQIAFDLKFDSAPFLYSWPSAGGITSYFYDRESATASRPHLRRFLELITKKTGVKSVSIIAHSMGNVALLEVLRDLKNATPDSVKINQIILAAPDVGVTNFKILAREIKGLANGITLYASSNDHALDISRQFFGGVPRAGDVPEGGPVVVEGIDTIDVSAVSTDSLSTNHSKYAQTTALMNDIERLLKTGDRPPQTRNAELEVVQKRGPGGGVQILPNGRPAQYWRYREP